MRSGLMSSTQSYSRPIESSRSLFRSRGQHVPRVGFDLEMARGASSHASRRTRPHVVLRRFEPVVSPVKSGTWKWIRHCAAGRRAACAAPRPGPGSAAAPRRAVRPPGADRSRRRTVRSRSSIAARAASASAGRVTVECRAELHAADPDAGRVRTDRAPRRVLELDREVAAVEADADVLEQESPRRGFADSERRARAAAPPDRQQPPLEELDGFVRVLDRAVRLGLDVEMDHRAGGPASTRDSASATRTTLRVIVSQLVVVGRRHPRLVGERRRRDAAVDAGRQQSA